MNSKTYVQYRTKINEALTTLISTAIAERDAQEKKNDQLLEQGVSIEATEIIGDEFDYDRLLTSLFEYSRRFK